MVAEQQELVLNASSRQIFRWSRHESHHPATGSLRHLTATCGERKNSRQRSLVRNDVIVQLQDVCSTPLAAAHAAEAPAIIDSGAEFDLLFTDVIANSQMKQTNAGAPSRCYSLRITTENAIARYG